MTLSEAVAEARGLKKRGVVLKIGDKPLRVLVAFGRLWIVSNELDRLAPFAPTVAQAADDRWRVTDDV